MLACVLLCLSHLNSPVEGIKWKYRGDASNKGKRPGCSFFKMVEGSGSGVLPLP